VFREDELKVKDPDGAAHLAAFNRSALNTIKQDESDKDGSSRISGNSKQKR
ncbi:ISAs1 family transposase, partial [Vibrio alginolyticus]|nr:ISAs1 family transposase [Vibrio alginolyticus]